MKFNALPNFKTNLTEIINRSELPRDYLGVDLLVALAYIFWGYLTTSVSVPLSREREALFYILVSVGFFECTREGSGSIFYLQGAVDSTPVGVFEHARPLSFELMCRGYFLDLVLSLYSLLFLTTKIDSRYLTHGVKYPYSLTRKSKGG